MDNNSKYNVQEHSTDMKFETKKSSKKGIIICSLVVLVLILCAVGYFVYTSKSNTETSPKNDDVSVEKKETKADDGEASKNGSDEIKSYKDISKNVFDTIKEEGKNQVELAIKEKLQVDEKFDVVGQDINLYKVFESKATEKNIPFIIYTIYKADVHVQAKGTGEKKTETHYFAVKTVNYRKEGSEIRYDMDNFSTLINVDEKEANDPGDNWREIKI